MIAMAERVRERGRRLLQKGLGWIALIASSI
jgi:hypothetical protein